MKPWSDRLKAKVYDVFLSHANADKPLVETLARRLREDGLKPFLDAWHLVPGESWQEALEGALESSRTCAVFMGKELGPWQNEEMRDALDERVSATDFRVIPVLLPGAVLPRSLRRLTWVDFRAGLSDDEAYRRLVCGIRGVKPDPGERPEPRYLNDEIRDLSMALKVAYRRRAELDALGEDLTEITQTVLDLRRRIREGGQLKAGDSLLDGRLELLEPIGSGGFAQVWKAYDESEHAVVAVKVLHVQYAEDRTRRERLFRGARQMTRLQHPGIVRVIEDKCEDGGFHFFVMEYVGGGDLRQTVRESRMSMVECIQIILDVGKALAFAHERGIIHRDVKPANILLDTEGRPKLTDFDLVRAADTTGGTRTTGLGTFFYAAPEAMMDARTAAEPADVYGLGMTTVFALHGADLPPDVLWEAPAFVAALEVGDSCRQAISRSIARKAEDRWQSVPEFCDALREAFEVGSADSAVGMDSRPDPALAQPVASELNHRLGGELELDGKEDYVWEWASGRQRPDHGFDMVIVGATGDLAQRKILPALYLLHKNGQLPSPGRILGVSRLQLGREEYLRQVELISRDLIPGADFTAADWRSFAERLDHVSMSVTDPSNYGELVKFFCEDPDRVRILYLATPPQLYGEISRMYAEAGLVTPQSRIVLEKPIGMDYESARDINASVGEFFNEEQIYRIDYYLGKEAVQNLTAIRFGNTLFEPMWRAEQIDHVQITVAETLGMESRGSYYDATGALRDMVQHHLLQLLCLVAMEPPDRLEQGAIRAEKIKVLRSLKPLVGADVARNTVRGQYRSGMISGHPVAGYLEEDMVDPNSGTETFVALKAEIDNWRWAGVPFYLRTGKRMAHRVSEIVIQLRKVPETLFPSQPGTIQDNRLVIRLQPYESIKLATMIKTAGRRAQLHSVNLTPNRAEEWGGRTPLDHERLLLDLIRGSTTLFMHRDEVDEAWRWVESISKTWELTGTRPRPYDAGTWGPPESAALMAMDNRSWYEETVEGWDQEQETP